jgi:hypothetical protein
MTTLHVGFDFRDSLTFVTDPTDFLFCGQNANSQSQVRDYAITPPYGWTTLGAENTRDRNNATGSAKTAGCHFVFNNGDGIRVLRIDLPHTGTYEIRLAAGDPGGPTTNYFRLLDNVTAFKTVTAAAANASDKYIDANGGLHTSTANWVANNVAVSHAFSSTILNFEFGDVTNGGGVTASAIATLEVTEIVTGSVIVRSQSIMSGGMQELLGGMRN